MDQVIDDIPTPDLERDSIDVYNNQKSKVTLTPPPPPSPEKDELRRANSPEAQFTLTPPQNVSPLPLHEVLTRSSTSERLKIVPESNSQASTSSQEYRKNERPEHDGDYDKDQPNDFNMFGDDLDVHERAERSKLVSTKNYDSEWRFFLSWLDKHGHKLGLCTDDMLNSRLSSSGMDYLLAEYLSNRYNMTAQRQQGIIVRLDPNTMGSTVSRLTSMVERNTDYRYC